MSPTTCMQSFAPRFFGAALFVCWLVFFTTVSAQELQSEFLFDIEIEVADPHVVGLSRNGDRGIYQVTGGRFVGPDLSGKVLNGADWALKRADGNFDLDVRLTLESDQGDVLYMHYTGILAISPDVLSALEQGSPLTTDQYYMRTTPRFETSVAKLSWLNTTVFIGVGRITETGVGYKVYAVK